MVEIPVAYAFSAGMVATINPCGAVMLPAWVSYYLGRGEPGAPDPPVALRAARGLAAGLLATLGFVLLFSVIGLIVSLGGRALIGVVPWAAVGIGAALVAFGVASFLGKAPHLVLPGGATLPAAGRGWTGVFLFGISYGIASLSCTLPIFLVVVGTALAAGGLVGGVLLFLSYSLGMGAVLVGLTVLAAAFKGAVMRWLRGVAPYVERLSALMLIGAGAYLILYWLPQFFGA